MKKIMFAIMICMFFISFASAWEWDNIKSYDEETDTITIVNALGLGEDIEKATLKENTYACSNDCYARKEITLYENGSLINDVRFFRIFSDGEMELSSVREYRLRYSVEVPEYAPSSEIIRLETNGTTIYNQKQIGSHEVWKEFSSGDIFEAGTYEVRLEGKKNPYWSYDWQINLQGRWTTEWSTWGNISLGNDSEVLLINVSDGFTTRNNTIVYNASGNVTSGATLTNLSLYTNSTGSWHKNQTETFVSGGSVEEGQLANDGGTGIEPINITATARSDGIISAVLIGSRGGAMTVNVSIHQNAVKLASGSISVDINAQSQLNFTTADYSSLIGATVNNGQFQIVISEFNGGNLNGKAAQSFSGSHFNYTNQGVNWKSFSDVNDINLKYSNLSVITFASQKFVSQIPDGATVWNVQGCDSDGDCGFAVSNRTVILAMPPTITLIAPANNTNTTNNLVNFNVTVSDTGGGITNVSLFVDNVLNQSNTSGINGTYLFSGTFADGQHDWLITANSSMGNTVSEFRRFTIDSSIPGLIITAPTGNINFHEVNTNLSLLWNYTDLSPGICIFQYGFINTTITCTDNVTSFAVNNSIDRNITFYSNDTFGNSNVSFTSWDYLIFQSGSNFNSSTWETATEIFYLNITTNGTTPSSATLTYNNTAPITATITNLAGNIYNISASRFIPFGIGNKTFFFNITLNGFIGGSTVQQQNVSSIELAKCNATNIIPFINFTFKNETLSQEDITATVDMTFTYSLSNIGDISKTLTFSNATENTNYTFCFDPSNREVNTILNMTYNNAISQQRAFTLIRALSDVLTSQILYLLPTTEGLFSQFKTVTNVGDTVPAVRAIITRVLGGNTITVTSGITDGSGFINFFLNPDVTYIGTFSKTGFTETIFSFVPTTDLRTVLMGQGVSVIGNGTVISQGTNYTFSPTNATLNSSTTVRFWFNVTSSQSVTLISMNITNRTGNQLLFVSNATQGQITGSLNTSFNDRLIGYFIIQTANETITFSNIWAVGDLFEGDYSLFKQLKFVPDYAWSDFIRILLVLGTIFSVLIFMTNKQVLEGAENTSIVALLLVWVFSVVGWLDTGLVNTATNSNINTLAQFSSQYGIAILTSAGISYFILRRLFIRKL